MTSSTEPRHPLDVALPSVHVVSNPVRRGPVVLATDGRSESGAVARAAGLIAARLKLPLEVVTVLDRSPTSLLAPEAMSDELHREARESSVRRCVARFADGAVPARVHVRFGRVSSHIARIARESSATLVVMGSAPHRRYEHTVSGRRAAQVLHTAPCPVLSIPPTFSALPRTIVVGVDFGPSSIRAAQAALLVAGEGATVFLTHIRARPIRIQSSSMSETDILINTDALFDLLLEDIAASIPDGVNVKQLVVAGDAIDGILSAAADVKADLIAVGTHGRGSVTRLFVGSVTEAIVHHADQAVLASPRPPRGDIRGKQSHDDDPPDAEHGWPAALDAFTQRNIGRTATLEILDPNVGPHITGHGYAFLGATYELRTHRVTIMVGDAERPTQHLTRSVPYPDAITIRPAPSGDGEILDIRHGQGHTLVTVSSDTE